MRAIIELQPNMKSDLTFRRNLRVWSQIVRNKEPVIMGVPDVAWGNSRRSFGSPGSGLFVGCKAELLDLIASFTTMSETKKCSECQMEISSKATKCPHCQTDLRAWVNKHPYATVFLGFFLLISVIMASSDDTSTESVTSGPEVTPATTQNSTVSIGSEGYLRVGEDKQVLVGTTEEAQNSMMKSFTANDTAGVAELMLQGKIFAVNSGTKVLVVDRASLGVRKIRILEGNQMYKTGFVPMEFIKSN